MDSEETTEKEITLKDVFDELVKVNKRLDAHDAQFETIREGIVHNSVAFDRLQSVVYSLRANITELTEEVRRNQKTLSLK